VEATVVVDGGAPVTVASIDDDADLWHALVLAVRDYLGKTGQRRAVVGLSGGIDSALVATIAAAALGPGNVTALLLPSRYSSEGSLTDARALAKNVGLGAAIEVPIGAAHDVLARTIAPALGAEPRGVADENLQSRVRGILLMAHANSTGDFLLATSNKSELATGYSTLYGDMCGALAVLGDVTKTRVYDLARWINAHPGAGGFRVAPIPEASITKPPSAELRPGQTDQDTLPPYDVLDAIIERYVDLEQSIDRIVAETHLDRRLVTETARRIDRAEFKRFQAPISPKVTARAFGRGRPFPLVMG
jgi:NAD+ synthetase